LDLGCCEGTSTKNLGFPEKLHVDLLRRPTAPEPFLQADIRNADTLFRPKSYDAVFAIDVVEHLYKDAGLKLIRDMEAIARKSVVFFTPHGSLWVCQDDNPDSHHSGWIPEEFEALGYRICLWPEFHIWADKHCTGAFLAWKRIDGVEIDPASIGRICGLKT
jgi:hypothetical protein